MSRKIIAVDICNTLADINSEIQKVYGASPVPSVYHHPKVNPEFFRNNLWIFEKANPFTGAAEQLTEISKTYKIIYITARPKAAQEVTIEWLQKNNFPKGIVFFTTKKAILAKSLGVMAAIEDAPNEIEGYISKGIPVIVKKQPYNTAYRNLFDWAHDEIKSYLCHIKENKIKNARIKEVYACERLQVH